MASEELERRRFNQDEVGELIELATRLDQLKHEGRGLSFDELRQVALELGISDEALMTAVHDRMEQERRAAEAAVDQDRSRAKQQKAERKRLEDRRKQLNEWKQHLASYVSVIGGLAAIDWFTGDGLDWVMFPAAGWGIGLAIHTFTVAFRIEDDE